MLKKKTFQEYLEAGLMVGNGYLFLLEKWGYVQIGSFVPEVVLNHPGIVEELHEAFVRCGSNVVIPFTYYGHREKMRLIGKEHLLELLNKKALAIGKKVADKYGVLLSGDISNTNIYDPNDEESIEKTKKMFEEQIGWAKEAGVDYMIIETMDFLGEALLAVNICKRENIPCVVTLALSKRLIREGIPVGEAAKKLEEAGAAAVGLNCARGPATMLPLIKEIVESVKIPVAALPVPYKTTEEKPNFQALCCEKNMYSELEPYTLTRHEMAQFAQDAWNAGARIIGFCCGGEPYMLRSMCEQLGRKTIASEFSPNLNLHFAFGNDPSLKKIHTETKNELLLNENKSSETESS